MKIKDEEKKTEEESQTSPTTNGMRTKQKLIYRSGLFIFQSSISLSYIYIYIYIYIYSFWYVENRKREHP